MNLPGWLPWLLLLVLLVLEGTTAGFAISYWRQLGRVRRLTHRLAQEGRVGEVADPSPLVQAMLQDLCRIEDRLREIGQRMTDADCNFRSILSGTVEGILILDRQLRIRLLNHRLQEMFGLPRPPLGQTPLEAFRNHLLHQVIHRTVKGDSPQSAELQVELRGAEGFVTKHFRLTAVRLEPEPEGEFAGLLLVFHDTSEVRLLEAIRKEFVANVSHEMRTPLSILSGYLETLLDGEVDQATTRHFLETMYRHAGRLNALLEDLLLLSQLESRTLPLHLATITAQECFARVLDQFEPVIAKTGSTVTVAAPVELSFTTDSLRLEQALFNLVDNALKYGTRPGLQLTLAAQADGGDVVLTVADNGPGIPLRDQPHIFERFYRVHKDRSRDAGGTGLGLSIVKHTVQALGGSVSVESSPGKGATFTIRLPARTSAEC
ncbi:MAG: PAS domain-containing protein [Verrucomicrobia bacterium]|nr:PAS domain-containing protein [Verrucomicrobiota bacterium]